MLLINRVLKTKYQTYTIFDPLYTVQPFEKLAFNALAAAGNKHGFMHHIDFQ